MVLRAVYRIPPKYLLAAFLPGLCASDFVFAQWLPQNSGTKLMLNDVCFVDSSYGWAVGERGTILHTENGGQLWSQQSAGEIANLLSVSFCNRMSGWITRDSGMALHTIDGGKTWVQVVVDTLPITRCVKVQTLSDSNCVILTDRFFGDYYGGSRIFKTSDKGTSWRDISPYFAAFRYIKDMFYATPTVGLACGFGGSRLDALQIHRTQDGGSSWDTYNFNAVTYGSVQVVYFSDSTRAWAAADSLYHSADGGRKWICVAKMPMGYSNQIIMFGDTGWANPWLGSIFRSSDGGKSWDTQTHYPYSVVRMSFVSKTLGWAVGYGGLILHTTNGGITSVDETYTERGPTASYELRQNFPNPFNPSTMISFVTSQRGLASIRLYDVLGRQSGILFADDVNPGVHSFTWRPTSLAAGVYFYQLEINGFRAVKKLCFIE